MAVKSIVWFRQDLRIHDNPALKAAAENGDILPVYILDDAHAGKWSLGGASKWWLHHSLTSLNKSLGHSLLVFSGDPYTILNQLIEEYGCSSVVWNRCYEPWQIQRDTQIKSKLAEQHIHVQSLNGALLWEPLSVLKNDGTPYRVFTPFYRKGCLVREAPRSPVMMPKAQRFISAHPIHQKNASDEGISALQLLPTLGWDSEFSQHWQPGETGAQSTLKRFVNDAALHYKSHRDFPNLQGTSRLSPHLHFGEISIHQIWYAIHQLAAEQQMSPFDNANLDCYLSELGWREFSYYLLYHFPYLPEQNHQPKFNAFPWESDAERLAQWQYGQTGYPIIDAGMRELWQTGYMHNRVRMIVASFLVKNLLIDWRLGQAWFWDCLLDADLASNAASWQWVAGSGADAAPYFRIFNPVTQGKKFDAEGDYVKRFVPELAALPKKYIHEPWKASESELSIFGIQYGKTYPKPMVDLSVSRKNALAAFEICQNK